MLRKITNFLTEWKMLKQSLQNCENGSKIHKKVIFLFINFFITFHIISEVIIVVFGEVISKSPNLRVIKAIVPSSYFLFESFPIRVLVFT